MTNSTINSHVYHGVTLDNATYFSPLTVTSTGIVTPVDGDAVYASSGFGAATIVNHGIITGGSYGDGIDLKDGGSVYNQGGTITGSYGIYFSLVASSLTNTGTIIGTERDGVDAGNGINVNNSGTAALIEGKIYGIFTFGVGTISNTGTITASGFGPGVGLGMGGSVDNSGTSALIESYIGVRGIGVTTITNAGVIIGTGGPGAYLHDGGTIIDSGTISGAGTTAIIFDGTGNDRLALEHGYTLGGGVSLVGTGNVVGLLGTAGAVTLDFNKVGAGFTQFGTFAFGAPSGNDETLKISNTLAAPGTIASFNAPHDIVDLTQINPTGAVVQFDTISNIMTISNGSQSATLQLDAEDYSTVSWLPTPDGSGGTDVAVVCYCRGTRILTPDGAVPVEALVVDDHVLTQSGKARPIKWVGIGRVMVTRGRRSAATPVIVYKHAIAHGVPNRDLHVTKGHCLYIDDVLIPVEFLVNHRSIVWDDRAQEVELYHIELETHDILIADGAPAESYRDDGNRWLFRNANSGWDLPPQEACVPILSGGPVVDAVWRRLLFRAGPRSGFPLTTNADLHLVVDGARVDGTIRGGGVLTFRLAQRPQRVRIVSRAAAPDQLGIARDPRELGVALRRIELVQGRKLKIIEAADERLGEGFYLFEAGETIRWTNGDAVLPTEVFEGFDGPVQVELTVAHTTQYVMAGKVA